jgi:hypothetical protein
MKTRRGRGTSAEENAEEVTMNARKPLHIALLLFFSLALPGALYGAKPETYVGVWHSGQGNGAQWTKPALEWADFAKADKAFFDQGLRLVGVSALFDWNKKVPKYVGTWRSGLGGGAQWTNPAANWPEFSAINQGHISEGLRLVSISVFNRFGQPAYVGVWRPGSGAQKSTAAVEWDAFTKLDKTYFDQGMRLVSISATYNVEGKTVYAAFWRGGQGTGAQWTQPAQEWDSFAKAGKAFFDKGLRLAAFSVFYNHGKPLYIGTWRSGLGNGAEWINPATDWSSWAAKDKGYFDKGLRLVGIAVAQDTSVPID